MASWGAEVSWLSLNVGSRLWKRGGDSVSLAVSIQAAEL